jgi:cytochrome c-type biogenesis protein CcsB
VANLSVDLFYAGMIATGAAAMCFLLHAVAIGAGYRQAATEAGTVPVPGAVGGSPALAAWGRRSATFALLLLSASLVARTVATGHPPYTNMWEYQVAFGWAILVFFAIFDWRYRQPALGAFVLPVAFALFAVSALFFPSRPEPLVPALQANRIMTIHVGTMILAYSSLSVSFGAAALYLAQGRQQRFPHLPRRRQLDTIAYRSVAVGVPLLALGIGLGAYWGYSAWGRYWGWDPKETAALVTWLVYAAYLHLRGLKGWQGDRSAWLLVGGYASVMFTYFAVNLWVSGLHSYAGV